MIEKSDLNQFDMLIYGGTSAGVIGAVQGTRMNKKVALIEPSHRLGGLSSGGLGDTDFGEKSVIGGLSGEFYSRVGAKYNKQEPALLFEPKVALEVFEDLVKEYDIPVFYGERLREKKGVTTSGNQIESIEMESGKVFKAKIFLDMTYEGDLMAQAGITYVTGRESNSQYQETYNGIQTATAVKNQLPLGVDPYVIQGEPSSGLLPSVNPAPENQDGEADNRIQAYCYRMCLTDVPENRLVIEKPNDYDEREFELLFRSIEQGEKTFFKFNGVPNRKTDSNNDSGFSTDYIGMNYDYPEASYLERERIAKKHETYQKGLVWTLQNHPRVPTEIRERFAPWGLPLDEFVENDHWTPQLYIRESRRMVSSVVMNDNHIMSKLPIEDSVGLGAYTMDSHNVQRYVDEKGNVRNEGDVQIPIPKPYPISYRSMIPLEEECTNLMVPVCLSASHIAYGSIRMEPVFMVLAQSAVTAAALAIEEQISIQQVNYQKLSQRLVEDGQIISF
ncbi:FAD-dependent oxidoreductase [Aquibacillus saliphilus]|uniref:FAD-dependent oxidoreductase n=1 Tax=Aquibacillus saliphilus TaxID=1909422 RepID=UPI001CEFEDDA|nr:FAD-dependent oxidoreductase [Aquibacillus saliphilus]